ncbi:2-hydroxychromene-2-carboxylate isomerase [Chondromyces crocatus]|uniref:2-hydroxychromene-2-carboxylate isomerase n=1 Tax=Chondromyces crocatus TaxID=52 RepID=A0A0K1E901_CHOCO|nr:2-hydroxychromene-2-carboxylate isomerase [Chondromyces crocatus]AKT37350.1 2-hydroxychromene-2-carboxylate isomerase [Chondromyces crocatus]
MKRVVFFYDFSCPYAYLAHTQIEAVTRRAGAELVWSPFLLGGVFKALGVPQVPAEGMPPAKARHNDLDMHRWADHWGVPLRMPSTHPNRTVLALRATLASHDLPRASRALFDAYWVQSLDVSQPSIVRDALDGAGLDGSALVARADDPAIKDQLRQHTDTALAAGVFGAPAFLVTTPSVSGALFWGQDRFDLVERTLDGWIPPEFRAAPSEVTP